MLWEVRLDLIRDWLETLDDKTALLVASALKALALEGPALGRPFVDRVKGSRLHNLKELRPGSSGRSEIRMLFVFDPDRNAVMLVAGDKSGTIARGPTWDRWYRRAIPEAERRYAEYLAAREDGNDELES